MAMPVARSFRNLKPSSQPFERGVEAIGWALFVPDNENNFSKLLRGPAFSDIIEGFALQKA